MGAEARGLVLVMTLVLVFGLAVLYSASAIIADQENHNSWFYVARQLTGVLAGVIAFAIAAKVDAEKLQKMAWPMMWLTILALLLCLVLPESIAPRVNGDRDASSSVRRSSSSELGEAGGGGVDVDAHREEGRPAQAPDEGRVAVLRHHRRALDVLAALEPDLSVSMLYTLILAVLLFAGGVRIAHFVTICALAIPLLWKKIESTKQSTPRCCDLSQLLRSGRRATTQMKYQLKQSLIAVGSRRRARRGLRSRAGSSMAFSPFPYSDFIASNIGEEWGFVGLAAITIAFAARMRCSAFRIARKARSQFLHAR